MNAKHRTNTTDTAQSTCIIVSKTKLQLFIELKDGYALDSQMNTDHIKVMRANEKLIAMEQIRTSRADVSSSAEAKIEIENVVLICSMFNFFHFELRHWICLSAIALTLARAVSLSRIDEA